MAFKIKSTVMKEIPWARTKSSRTKEAAGTNPYFISGRLSTHFSNVGKRVK